MTHRWFRLILATLLTLSALIVIGTSTVVAQAPDNDSVQSPVDITGVPFHYEQDTSEATADPADGGCGGPDDLATVWFRFTPQNDVTVLFDTAASSYSTGVNLYVEEAGSLTLINCSFPPLFADLSAGVTYVVMVVACCDGVNGGTWSSTSRKQPARRRSPSRSTQPATSSRRPVSRRSPARSTARRAHSPSSGSMFSSARAAA